VNFRTSLYHSELSAIISVIREVLKYFHCWCHLSSFWESYLLTPSASLWNLKLFQIPKIRYYVQSRSSFDPVLILLIPLHTHKFAPCLFVTHLPDFTTMLCIRFLFLPKAWRVLICPFIQYLRRVFWKYAKSEKRHLFEILIPYGGE